MPYIPATLVKDLAKSLINGEGQSVIYRKSTITTNPAAGTSSASDSDTALTAYVGARKRAYINGTLVQVPGERLLISALDLPIAPVAGDTVILGATESTGIRRRVVSARLVSTQGQDLIYSVEVE